MQVCALLLLLYFIKVGILANVSELLLSILFLIVIPILAYPLAVAIPRYHKRGREGQRKLAFILSLAGYTAGVVYGLLTGIGQNLMLIYLTYFISVVVLIVFNKLITLRASGHACSITGPLILAVYFIGWKSFLPCAALFAAIIWASLVLKRHTPRELLWGSFSAAIAFALSLLLV